VRWFSHFGGFHSAKSLNLRIRFNLLRGKRFRQVDLALGLKRWFLCGWVGPMAASPGRKEGVIPGAHEAHPYLDSILWREKR
jgi:hypothetical protein